MAAMESRNHRQAGKPAVGTGSLPDNRRPMSTSQQFTNGHRPPGRAAGAIARASCDAAEAVL
jgi:hypothetical protein